MGAALGLAAALVYCTYILISEGVAARVRAARHERARVHRRGHDAHRRLAGVGDLDPGAVSAAGFAWLGALALLSTVGAIALFFAGLRRVGPTAASILSTLEPVVTVGLAFAGLRRIARRPLSLPAARWCSWRFWRSALRFARPSTRRRAEAVA